MPEIEKSGRTYPRTGRKAFLTGACMIDTCDRYFSHSRPAAAIIFLLVLWYSSTAMTNPAHALLSTRGTNKVDAIHCNGIEFKYAFWPCAIIRKSVPKIRCHAILTYSCTVHTSYICTNTAVE